MANLIITVISIALVAVAALSAAYYGGSAFMDGQAKSQAVTIQNNFEQIAAAAVLYEAENGHSVFSAGSGYPGRMYLNAGSPDISLLVPKYLNKIPEISLDYFYTSIEADPINEKQMWVQGTVYSVNDQNIKMCKEIAKISRGPNADAIVMSVSNDFTAFSKFDCGIYDDSGYINIYFAYRLS
jgi:hypothetical protein